MISGTTKRVLVVLMNGCVLAAAVVGTHGMLRVFFGSTPFVTSIELFTTYGFESTLAAFQGAAGSAYAAAASATQGGGEQSNRPARSIPVLTYHRIVSRTDINNVTEELFEEQMTILKKAGWSAVTLEDFEKFMRGEKELPEKSFLLTFDDGAKDSFYPVDPVLRKLGYTASIFIIVQSSKTQKTTYYLTPQEIGWVLKTGRWSIGSHSYDGHRQYPTDVEGESAIFFADRLWNAVSGRLETPEEFSTRVRNDLQHSKNELEEVYKRPINTFAFPLGNETGIEGANNFPEGASITEVEARKIYEFGFVQTNNQQYSSNFPHGAPPGLAADFLAYRIHVDYDWGGARLLEIMENGLPKNLPFEDDFSQNRGWIPAWGSLDLGRNNFMLTAAPDSTGASTFLDGTALLDNYSLDLSANWQAGTMLVLADVQNAQAYHSCAFSPGTVRIQETKNGTTRTLAEKNDKRIAHADGVSAGIRVHDSVIECTWEFESLVETYNRNFSGGVGIQTYDPDLGTARLQVSSVIVRPYATDYAE